MTLPPDPDSVEKWKGLPQNTPSSKALPPATGGMNLARALLIGLILIGAAAIIIGLLTGQGI